MGTEVHTVSATGEIVQRARSGAREPPRIVAAVAVVFMLLGILALAVLPIYVVAWAREGEGAFDRALRAKGLDPIWAEAIFLLWMAIGVSFVLAGRWLRRGRRRGMWLAGVCAMLLLAGGLADTARADIDAGTVLLQYAFPLLALYAIVRHHALLVE